MKPRNPAAHARSTGALRQRVVKAKRGKGSYSRKDKHKSRPTGR